MKFPDLSPVLGTVQWAAVGAAAARLYMPERTTRDLADVPRMLGQANDEGLAAVRVLFAQWLPDEREDLDSLIELGRLEMER